MVIALSGQRIQLALTHGAGRLTFALFKRLRNANLPLLVAFVGALIMFTRALSGAGFEDVNASATLQHRNALDNSSSFWNSYGALGHSRWARLRSGVADTLWRCPGLSEELSNSTESGTAYTPGCLKAKFQNVVRARTVLLGGKAIAKDPTDFEVPNFPSLLSSPSASPQQPPEVVESPPPAPSISESIANPTTSPSSKNTPPLDEGMNQAVEQERPRANWPSKHGDSFGSRSGFEIRRKPH